MFRLKKGVVVLALLRQKTKIVVVLAASAPRPPQWLPPPPPFPSDHVKINVDTFVSRHGGFGVVGTICRDRGSTFSELRQWYFEILRT